MTDRLTDIIEAVSDVIEANNDGKPLSKSIGTLLASYNVRTSHDRHDPCEAIFNAMNSASLAKALRALAETMHSGNADWRRAAKLLDDCAHGIVEAAASAGHDVHVR